MKKLLISILMIGTLVGSGCITKQVYVTHRMPIIEMVERPQLSEYDDPVTNINKMMEYSIKLENVINIYNEWAKEENLKSGYDF